MVLLKCRKHLQSFTSSSFLLQETRAVKLTGPCINAPCLSLQKTNKHGMCVLWSQKQHAGLFSIGDLILTLTWPSSSSSSLQCSTSAETPSVLLIWSSYLFCPTCQSMCVVQTGSCQLSQHKQTRTDLSVPITCHYVTVKAEKCSTLTIYH